MQKKGTRVQKALSDCGYTSRRKAESLIASGAVQVNGRPVKLGDKCNPARDLITVNGEKIVVHTKQEKLYIMLHKPRGYVTTLSDEHERRCVASLVEDVGQRVYPVGRLDKNSEGLLLLTNDGEFANLMMHPSHHVSKVYRVTVRPDINDEQAAKLAEGVVIDGRKTAPSVVRVLDKQPGRVVLEMVLREGRNRQIRKMCEAVGLEVARLKRVSIGPVKLGMLKPGAWRPLQKSELIALRNAAKPSSEQPESEKAAYAKAGDDAASSTTGGGGRQPKSKHAYQNGKPAGGAVSTGGKGRTAQSGPAYRKGKPADGGAAPAGGRGRAAQSRPGAKNGRHSPQSPREDAAFRGGRGREEKPAGRPDGFKGKSGKPYGKQAGRAPKGR